jgi:hypothetical protein
MSFEPDTSTCIAGVAFKNPILVASSELIWINQRTAKPSQANRNEKGE